MSTTQDQTAKVRRVWEKGAPDYDKQIAFFEKIWFGGGRQWLGARAWGRVLEVAIGTGLNLPHTGGTWSASWCSRSPRPQPGRWRWPGSAWTR